MFAENISEPLTHEIFLKVRVHEISRVLDDERTKWTRNMILTQAVLFERISVMSMLALVALPTLGVTATLEAASGFLVARTSAASARLAGATGNQGISEISHVTAFKIN